MTTLLTKKNDLSQALARVLDELFERYHRQDLLASDPLEFVHRYRDPWDQEAVALLGALLAYGNVRQIRQSVQNALGRMQTHAAGPAAWVRALAERGPAWGEFAMEGWVHRFNVGEDLVLLFWLVGRSWSRFGSVGAHFVSGLSPEAPHIGPALDRLLADWRSWREQYPGRRPLRDSAAYFFTSPSDGSCCKRWCMFLRWMGRKDELDPGLWAQGGGLASGFPEGRWVRPSQLVLPIDTHTGRISQYIGLTRRKSLNWKAAVEITDALRRCHSEDPTRYDFALARLGILDLCQKRFRVEICERCSLLPVCRYARRKSRR